MRRDTGIEGYVAEILYRTDCRFTGNEHVSRVVLRTETPSRRPSNPQLQLSAKPHMCRRALLTQLRPSRRLMELKAFSDETSRGNGRGGHLVIEVW